MKPNPDPIYEMMIHGKGVACKGNKLFGTLLRLGVAGSSFHKRYWNGRVPSSGESAEIRTHSWEGPGAGLRLSH